MSNVPETFDENNGRKIASRRKEAHEKFNETWMTRRWVACSLLYETKEEKEKALEDAHAACAFELSQI